jgi:hypothetical protein
MKQRRKRLVRELVGKARKKVIDKVKIDPREDFWHVTDKNGTKHTVSGVEAMNVR